MQATKVAISPPPGGESCALGDDPVGASFALQKPESGEAAGGERLTQPRPSLTDRESREPVGCANGDVDAPASPRESRRRC
jgi:hypothetical protein